MADVAPLPPPEAEAGSRPHGTPPGAGIVRPAHGGQIGNPPYVRDEALALRVRNESKLFPPAGERLLARRLGVTQHILRTYYAPELETGRGELMATLAAQEIALAMDAKSAVAKGDPSARRWLLTKMGGWVSTNKVEVSGPEGGPIEHRNIDLTKFNAKDLADYGRLAAIAHGIDPNTIPAVPDGDDIAND
jgi:hypothetical protein